MTFYSLSVGAAGISPKVSFERMGRASMSPSYIRDGVSDTVWFRCTGLVGVVGVSIPYLGTVGKILYLSVPYTK